MKIIGVIPARFASTRFPGKPLAKLAGKTLLEWTYLNALKSKKILKLYIATDDDRIKTEAEKFGAPVLMTESHWPSGTDRINAAVSSLESDIVINIQGDEPLVNPAWIDELASELEKDSSLQMGTLAHPLTSEDYENLNAVKVILNQNGEAIYFSRFPIPFSRKNAEQLKAAGHNDPSVFCLKHIGMYGYRTEFLKQFCAQPISPLEEAESLEQLRALTMGAKIKVIKVSESSIGVDTPEDLVKAEKILEQKIKAGQR